MDGNEYTCDSCGLKSAEPMWRDWSPLKKRVVSHCDDCCSYVEVNGDLLIANAADVIP